MITAYWLEQTEAGVPDDPWWLSPAERLWSSHFRIPKRRRDWLLGRWTGKLTLAALLDGPQTLSAIEIRPAADGSPLAFVHGSSARWSISLTHRGGAAACAAGPSDTALGCDLEIIEPRSDAFLADYFSAGEAGLSARLHGNERFRLAALLWSAKESVLKALHAGLRLDPRSVHVEAAGALELEDDQWHGFSSCVGGQSFEGWWQCRGGFVRTLAASPPPAPPVPLDNIAALTEGGPPGLTKAALVAGGLRP
jgi:4'-phosphopantetheinyl transferase